MENDSDNDSGSEDDSDYSEELSYAVDSEDVSESSSEVMVHVTDKNSILTPEASDMGFERSTTRVVFVDEDELYSPDIFDAEIDETEVFITEDAPPTPADWYAKQCHKYMEPPIALVKTALDGAKYLNLSRYMPHTINLHYIFQTIVTMPKSHITHLDLSQNRFESDACYMLSDLLQQSSTLLYLNLEQCEIGPKGAEILAEGIELSQSLIHLNLSKCNLRDSGGALIVAAVTSNENIKALNLSRNFLHVETAVCLQKMLKENDSLEALNIKWNDLFPEKEASVKIMNGLRWNTSLKFMDMSWNGIAGTNFASALNRVMRFNKSLRKLMLKNNYLSTKEIPPICAGILRAKTLQELHIGGNLFNLEDFEALIDAVNMSPALVTLHLGKYTYLSENAYNKAVEFNRLAQLKYVNVQGIVFGGKLLPNPPQPVDFKGIIADRAKFLAMKPKKKKLRRNMGHFMLKLLERPEDYMKEEDFTQLVADFKLKLDEELVDHFVQEFREKIQVGKKKRKRTAIKKMAEHYLTRHPTEPPPPPPPKKKKEKKKGKEKGQKKKK